MHFESIAHDVLCAQVAMAGNYILAISSRMLARVNNNEVSITIAQVGNNFFMQRRRSLPIKYNSINTFIFLLFSLDWSLSQHILSHILSFHLILKVCFNILSFFTGSQGLGPRRIYAVGFQRNRERAFCTLPY